MSPVIVSVMVVVPGCGVVVGVLAVTVSGCGVAFVSVMVSGTSGGVSENPSAYRRTLRVI